jgi:ATP-dependent Clp protease ATP-binding subunit ClpC
MISSGRSRVEAERAEENMHKRFTDQARQVAVRAQDEASLLNHDRAGTEHILLAFFHEQDSIAAKALLSLGITPEAVRAVIRQAPGRKQEDRRAPVAKYTRQAENVLDLSLHEALRLGDNQIGTEHILLALTREPGSVAVEVLARMNIDPKRISHQIVQLRKFAREESLRR